MIPASRATRAAILSSYDFRILADVYHGDGERLIRAIPNVPLTSFSIEHDSSAEVQGSSSGEFVVSDSHGRSIAPRQVDEALAPFTSWLSYRCVFDTESPEAVRLGFHNLTAISDPATTYEAVGDFEIVASQAFSFAGKDAFVKTQRERFTVPTQAQDRSSVWAELARLTSWPAAVTLPDRRVPGGMTYDPSRMTAVYDLGKLLGGVPFMDHEGSVSARPIAWPAMTVDISPIVTSAKSDIWNADLVYNGVFVRSYGEDPEEGETVLEDTDDGDSQGDFTATIIGSAVVKEGALRWGRPSEGAFGMIPYFASTPSVRTTAQGQAYAESLLPQVSKLQAVGASVTMAPHPLLQTGDVVRFPLDGTPTRGRITKIRWSGLDSMTLEVLLEQR